MRYGVIGCGKMGFVILESLVSLFPNKHNSIFVSDIDQKKLSFIKKKFGIKITKSNFELTDVCDIIILSIKPQQMVEVLDEIKDGINKNKLIISIAAGIKLDFIKKIISKKVAIVRCMPNLPLKYGFGLTAFCANCYTSSKQKTFVKKLFSSKGKVIEIAEQQMDSITAISGSGPAYIFYISEIMQEIAQKFGFDIKTSELIVNQTILGAAQMLNLSNTSAKQLKQDVTSKGGTTEQALKFFHKNGLEKIFFRAINKARLRAKELSKMLE